MHGTKFDRNSCDPDAAVDDCIAIQNEAFARGGGELHRRGFDLKAYGRMPLKVTFSFELTHISL